MKTIYNYIVLLYATTHLKKNKNIILNNQTYICCYYNKCNKFSISNGYKREKYVHTRIKHRINTIIVIDV